MNQGKAPGKMFWRSLLYAMLPFALAMVPQPVRPVPALQPRYRLEMNNNLFTLHADQVPLSQILSDLSRVAGVEIRVDPSLDTSITAECRDLSLESLLHHLTESYALILEETADGRLRVATATVTSSVRDSGGDSGTGTSQERAFPECLGDHVVCNSPRPMAQLLRRDSLAILLRNAVIDTRALLAENRPVVVPEAYRADPTSTCYLVQFTHPVGAEDRAALHQAGASVLSYVPNHALLVRTDPGTLAKLNEIPGVYYVGPFHPYYRLDPRLLKYLETGDPGKSTGLQRGQFNLILFPDVADARETLEQYDVQVLSVVNLGGRTFATVRCDPARAADLARTDIVQWVEPAGTVGLLNDLAVRRVGAPALRLSHPELDGSGVIVGVMDTGIDFNHRAFAEDPSQPTSTNLNTRIVYYEARPGGGEVDTNGLLAEVDGIPGDAVGHGTHVSASILGNGALSETVNCAPGSGTPPYGTNTFAGVAPAARLVMLEGFAVEGFGWTAAEAAYTEYAHGARVSANSWGNPELFDYGTESAIWDALVRDADTNSPGNQQLIVFFAAGNEGAGTLDGSGGFPYTIREQGCAKNVVTVGALELSRFATNLPLYGSIWESDSDWQVAWFSSRGPVSGTDLRIKPDVVAPGSYVLSAQSKDTNPDEIENPPLPNRDYRFGNVDTGTNYAFMSGTSMATPIAAGAAALLYQYFTNTYGRAPSPAMIKAILVNSARIVNRALYRFPLYGSPPDRVLLGWGMVDVNRAVNSPGVFGDSEVVWLDEADTVPLETGQSFTYRYTVNNSDSGLKITLAWTDEPGSPENAVRLVNDLDLIVIDPEGQGYVGNLFDLDGWSSYRVADPTNSDYGDRYNNVEQVIIPEPDPGEYTIMVRAYEVPVAAQDFALAITKGVSPVGSHAQGDHPSMALDSNQWPVVAYSGYDLAMQKQIYVRRWKGVVGDQSEIGNWKRLDENWFDMDGSARETGISKTLEDSVDPSIALWGNNIFVAWTEQAPQGEPSHIYLKMWDGTNWVELGGSASDAGISGDEDYSAEYPTVAVHTDGLPVVCWKQPVLRGTDYEEEIRVAKWNGTNWVGFAGSHTNGITGDYISSGPPSMILDGAGRPVVAWMGLPQGGSYRMQVRRWNGSAWQDLGRPTSSAAAAEPSLALGPSGRIYVTWTEPGTGPESPYTQVYAAYYDGSWHEFGGSLTYPGISGAESLDETPYNPVISVASDGTVYIAWCTSQGDPNALYLKKYDGAGWSGLRGSDLMPGLSQSGGVATNPVVLADRYGLPVVTYASEIESTYYTFTYRVVTDEFPPAFGGLASASGGTNFNVLLSWEPASDMSTTIYYHIYRSTSSWPCGTDPDCQASNVFANEIAVLTNATSYEVTGLADGQVWCFGVRAEDTNGLMELNEVMRAAGPISAAGDTDGDCLINNLEREAGTEPCLADSDDDDMWDGWEWTYSTNNPAHTNSLSLDPLDNGTENYRTPQVRDGDPDQSPNADPDKDGASNLEEFQWWYSNTYLLTGCDATGPTNRIGPDPTLADSDGDGMDDGWEMFNDLDPVDPSDGALDTDGDGMNNSSEFAYGTDPLNPDSDSDGLSDGDEVTIYNTDPSLADTDRDGLDDGFELALGSDPTDADSNDSFVSDGDTFQLGWDAPATALTNFNILLHETFEAGSPTRTNWTHYWTDGNHPYDFWHLSTAEPDPKTNSVRYLYDHSTTTCYRMANDPTGTNLLADYSAGSIVQCALESPLIDARSVSNLFVAWKEYYQTEPEWDIVLVQARGGADSNWYVVSDARSGDSGGWTGRVADISRFAGMSNVSVRFLFSAQNDINNFYAGWFVDDVRIYEGVAFTGWVRDINGRPVGGAEVLAIGRGGVTNAVSGHRFVNPGKIFGRAVSADDGSYYLAGLPQGRYYLKVSMPGYRDEFYNGPLFSGGYGFGNQLNPGVFQRDQIGPTGYLDMTDPGALGTCHFEIEKGSSRSRLGVSLQDTGVSYPVSADFYQPLVWNGVTNLDTNLPPVASLVGLETSTNLNLADNHPDWLTNPVPPTVFGDIMAGTHFLQLGTNFSALPPASATLREGELTTVIFVTNQGSGRLYVTAPEGANYRVWIDGRDTDSDAPALIPVRAGYHVVALASTNDNVWTALREVTVPLGRRVRVDFSTNDVNYNPGTLDITTVDINGNEVTGAVVYVDGRQITSNEVATGYSPLTPTRVDVLQPGMHLVSVYREGYCVPAARRVTAAAGIINEVQFVLEPADADYDQVGDSIEIAGYTNIFLYHRQDDPDGDGLDNLLEFEQFRLFNVFLNPFDSDSDADSMPDGHELGFDGYTNLLAYSAAATNIVAGTNSFPIYFVGYYLDGTDNFGNSNVLAAVDCDYFEAGTVNHPAPAVPGTQPALTVFGGIPSGVPHRSIDQGHYAGATVLADPLPDQQDTDGDGMWDGYEYLFAAAGLNPIECAAVNDDPDFDGADNLREFLGADGIANTNDWSDPTNPDTDGDTMPDGWEYDNQLDPADPSDAELDSDSDGLINRLEYAYGCEPQNADTDMDGLPDGPEVLLYYSDPSNPDTDGDGLADGREVWDRDLDGNFDGGFFQFPSNQPPGDLDGDGNLDGPDDWDTDGDGMPDGFEVIDEFGNVRAPALNPYDPNDADEDYDGDGLSNLEEYRIRDALAGNPPGTFDPAYADIVWDYSTDPFDSDSDGDGLPDGWEAAFGLHPMDPIPTPDGPLTRYPDLGPEGDLDSDGLYNGREFNIRYRIHPGADSNSIEEASTNPWDPDTDKDGLRDGEEDRSFRSNPVTQDTDSDGLADGADMPDMWAEVESAPRNPDGSPAVTNHYDRALNDLWKLVWPPDQDLPSWERIIPDTNSPLPEPRWGAVATYNPVFETKTFAFNGKTYETTLLDNRQIIVIGGRDGVQRFTNIWEFVIRSNAWVRSRRSLEDIGLPAGLSEGAGILLLGYYDSRSDICPCDENQPYDCGESLFGLPKLRPWDRGYQRSSFDWTYILGGTDTSNRYYLAEPLASYYYKSTDSPDPITDKALVMAEGNNGGTIAGVTIVPIGTPAGGLQQTGVWTVAAEGWNDGAVTSSTPIQVGSGVTNGMFFDGLNIEAGSTIDSATLHLNFNSYGPATAQLSVVAELLIDGHSSSDYDADPPTWRYFASQFISSTQTVQISSSGPGIVSTNLNVPSLINQAVSQPNWATQSVGFLMFGQTLGGSNFHLRVGESELSVAWRAPSATYDYHGMYFENIFIRTNCEDVIKAELELSLTSSGPSSNSMTLVGELWADGESSGDYNGNPITNRLAPPLGQGLGELVTAPISFPLVANGTTVTSVDITPVFLELIQWPDWAAQSCGFIMWGDLSGNQMYLHVGKATLKVTYRPSYKLDAYWQPGTHLQVSGDQPSKRKSLAMAYDYDRDRLVVFGGMDGETVYGDTYEGTPVWNDLGGSISYSDPQSIGSPRLILWEKIAVSPSPAPRWAHSMVYDPVNQRVVLFGGFDANHAPLNDLWYYTADQTWHQVTVYADNQRPPPRAGAAMIFFGQAMYDRGFPDYCMRYARDAIVLFGGTDGEQYFNDTWVFKHEDARWILVNPCGEFSQSPDPRAFASFVFAQNAGGTPDPNGTNTFMPDSPADRCATPAAYLFGGRTGTIPTSPDTDRDLVPDGWEHAIGGTAEGHDPRENALLATASTNELLPFCYLRIGSVRPDGVTRGTIADLEALSYSEGNTADDYARLFNLPYQGYPLEGAATSDVFAVGVDGYLPEFTNLWYHRDGGDDPFGPGDIWELGRPDPSSIGTTAAPPYAHSGRWCFGTDLNGRYGNGIRAELYSPLFNLSRPPVDATCDNNSNTWYLIFYEWLDLNDTNDIVQVDALLPRSPAQIASRQTGTNIVTILPQRNSTWNTTGQWRFVAVPLDQLANETNVYIRFTLLTDSQGNAGGWYIDDVAIASGGEVAGLLTNAAGALDLAGVSLLSSREPAVLLTSTRTDALGMFELGFLPLGSYRLGAGSTIFGPFWLTPTNWTYTLGSTNVAPLIVSSVSPGYPVTISWPAVPGLTYELQYVDSLGDPWQTLAVVMAGSTNEVWYDYSAAPMRMYRVLVLSP